MNLDINPYYSSTKNKNIKDFCLIEDDIENKKNEEAQYGWNPYNSPIESHRGNSIYNAHSYPTKIDYRSIMKYILFHTKAGDIVMDPFSGSGTAGVAAIQCGKQDSEVIEELKELGANVECGERKALLIDLSTLATFISSSLLTKCNKEEFIKYVNELFNGVEEEFGWLYETLNENGESETIRQVIWSEVFRCPNCKNEESYWKAGVDIEKKKFNDKLTCSQCNNIYDKSMDNKVFVKIKDTIIDQEIETAKREPVRIYVQRGKQKYYRECNKYDIELIKKIEGYKLTNWVPNVKMMFKDGEWGEMYRSGYHKGITHVHHFYTKRNLIILSALWEKALKAPSEIRNKLLFVISSYNLSNSTLMTRAVFKSDCKDLVITGYQNGQLYIGAISVEKNILKGIREVKLKTILKAFDELNWGSNNIRISTQSNNNIDIPDNSVDYIFTDPPFGQDIIYSEMNFISEAWLKRYTENIEEAIICKSHGKTIEDYERLLENSFKEMYRVLKQGKSATIVFHNSKKDVWNATLKALYNSGFQIVDTSILDKKQGSIKQVKTSNAVSKDIVIHVIKSTNEIAVDVEKETNVWDYLDRIVDTLTRDIEDEIDSIKQILYSYYLSFVIKHKLEIEYDSKIFYRKVNERYKKKR
ncbi:DNA methyltransferase [Clostridium perfringens]|uniref:DNA methyltransferase n=1 Tax=Clostridium perfringens TaxID=1502 RepID=UPI0024BD1F34|nr:DNA methyltransferase [Clostridium perfringens]